MITSLTKFFMKIVYAFNRTFLGKFIPGITIANSKLYEKGDEYVKLRADGWVAVKSKKIKTLVSADTVKKQYV